MKACYFKLILQSFFFVYFNTIFFGKRVEQLFQYLIFDMLNLRIKIAAKKDVCVWGGGTISIESLLMFIMQLCV